MNAQVYIGLILSLAWWSNDGKALIPKLPSVMSLAVTDRPALPCWVASTSVSSCCGRRGMELLAKVSSSKDDKDDNASSPVLERIRIDGVSISPKGFHVLLETSGRQIVPLKVTNDPADSQRATSPESLTICQLLSGVDMAGAILPPESLSRLLVHHVEEKWQDILDESDTDGAADEDNKLESGHSGNSIKEGIKNLLSPQEQKVLEFVKKTLPENQDFYKDAHPWLQSRIRLPQVTLDQLTLVPVVHEDVSNDGKDETTKVTWNCRLHCALPDLKDRIVLDVVKPDVLAPLAFNYDPDSSLLFTCLALALRYKAPIVLEQSGQSSLRAFQTEDILERDFPQRTTVSTLQQQSSRVAENIERGFEIHKLTGALQIAMRLGDEKAVERIRAKLDEYDSLHDLPTIGSSCSTRTTTSSDKDEGQLDDDFSLDDLDKNILQ
jgi:hypothetical protein